MNIILLSGGGGKRLWPLSNDICSKQFIRILDEPDGAKESMVQRIFRQIRRVDRDAVVTVATSKKQISLIKNQLGQDVDISLEPCRRDTFPAIVLAVAYLCEKKGIGKDEPVIVCPADSYVEDHYFSVLQQLEDEVRRDSANLVLMGIQPTEPSDKYGYIIPADRNTVSNVMCFKEKPDVRMAEEYLKQGALWNGGVFAFRPEYILKRAHELLDFNGYDDLLANYEIATRISFDHAVVEKESRIRVVRYQGEWSDLGTWNTLVEKLHAPVVGNAKMDQCRDTVVINTTDTDVVAVGLDNVVIAVSPDGVLVTEKSASVGIKSLVDQLDGPVKYAEKSWGELKVVDWTETSRTARIRINAGKAMSLHSHDHRDEVWTVITGFGSATIGMETVDLKAGSTICIPRGTIHTIAAHTDMEVVEVQVGEGIGTEDKQKV